MFLGKNLKYLRKKYGLTQEELSEKLAVKRTMVSAYEDGRSEPKLNGLNTLVDFFNVSLDEFINHDISENGRKIVQRMPMKILALTLDRDDNENISLVGQKASAGYLNGYSDPEYMGNLPQFQLPNLSRNSSYRAFEIKGDSMLPLVSGTIIIGAYLEQLRDIKNGRTYILVTSNEGIVYKRVFNYLEENGKLFLSSDNELYKPYEIQGGEVLEVWEAKAYISTDFPNPKDKSDKVSLEDISRMILNLREDIIRSKP